VKTEVESMVESIVMFTKDLARRPSRLTRALNLAAGVVYSMLPVASGYQILQEPQPSDLSGTSL
jgi:hypothetical protein